MKDQLKQIAHQAVRGATDRGASGVKARVARSRSVSLTYRDGRPEKVEESTQRRLTLWLYVDGRYTSCETNLLERGALEGFLDQAVALTRAVEVDPDRVLPDPALYDGREDRDLELVDKSFGALTAEDRLRYVAAIEEAVKASEAQLQAVEAQSQDSESEVYQVHSNGFEGGHLETQRWAVADVSLKERGDRRPSGWGVAGTHRRDGLPEPSVVAEDALRSARARLGAGPIETAALPMIVESRAVGRLLRHLLAALGGRTLQQRASFLEGRRGETLGSEAMTITDDPFIPGGFGSRLFDGEGIAAKPFPLFDRGRLEGYYIDTYYGRKLGERPTTGASSNVVIPPGEASLEELIRGLDRGVLVRGFLGGNSNSTTGDFSLGVHGTMIERGELGAAVGEMNIAGNHLELWRRLTAVGSDLYPYSSIRSPSLLFDAVQFSGR